MMRRMTGDNNFDDWVVVYEIGNPTKFVLCYFDGSEAFLETVVDGQRRDSWSGTWTDVQVLQTQFVVAGKWDSNLDREVDDNE